MTKKQTTIRNVIMILMIIAFAACGYLTYDAAQSSVTPQFGTHMQGEQPPQMPSSDSQSSDSGSQLSSSESNDSSSSNQPPEMPSGDNQNGNSNGQPPEMPSGDNQNGNSNGQPPEMPSGDNQNGNSNGQPPEMPSGDNQSSNEQSSDSNSQSTDSANSDSNSGNQMPQMPSGDNMKNGKSISAIYYVAFAVEGLGIAALAIYLIMSHMNKRTAREALKGGKRIAVFALATVIIASCLTFAGSTAAGNASAPQQFGQMQQGGMPGGNSSESVDASGATTVDGKEQTLADSYTSTTADESAVLVTNGGSATITGEVNKKSGDSSNTENSEFYGVNAGVLVQADSTATIEGATITTSAKGSNAVFSTGENSKIYVKNTTIKTTGESSARGLDATYGGYIEADNVNITTQGGSCATLATDRGEGTVKVSNSTLETNGKGSPVIYSTGDISIDNTKGTANGSQNVVIEGKNSATVTDSTLTASGAGNRGDVDQAGVMIYQSMSGDASEGTGTFTAKNSSLSIQSDSDYYKTAPMFFITNTDAVINLTNTKLTFGSGTLISAKGTSEWGNSGSNGGNVTLNATSQTLKGNIEVDKISTASITLTKSTYEGTINGDNSAKEIKLTLDKDSKITLTGDSYVTSLENADSTNSNIDFNGYTLYVNGKAVNS